MMEITTFRLNDDVGSDAFLEMNDRFQQQFIYQQPGVVRRTLASGLEGEWLSITWWRSMKDARACAAAAATSSVAMAFASLVSGPSQRTTYFKELPG